MIYWGTPATFLVAGALFLERAEAWRSSRLVEAIGDASYSLYLTHLLLLYALSVIARKIDPSRKLLGDIVWVVFVAATVMLGLIVYRYVELPMHRWLKRHVAFVVAS